MSRLLTRGPVWGLALVAVVVAQALAARSDSPDLVRALGWSMAAAVGLSLLVGVLGRRLLGVAMVVLGGSLAAVRAGSDGHWGLLLGGLLAIAAGLGQLLAAARWPRPGGRYERRPVPSDDSPIETWKAMDAGLDPTAEAFGDNLAARAPAESAPRRPASPLAQHPDDQESR